MTGSDKMKKYIVEFTWENEIMLGQDKVEFDTDTDAAIFILTLQKNPFKKITNLWLTTTQKII